MNSKEFNNVLAKRVGLTQAKTAEALEAVVDAMRKNFNEGEPIMITNFGIFEVKKKNSRTIVNPATKQKMIIPEKLKLAFKPIDAWKDKINAKTEDQ